MRYRSLIYRLPAPAAAITLLLCIAPIIAVSGAWWSRSTGAKDGSDNNIAGEDPSPKHIIALTSCHGFVGRRLVDSLLRLYPHGSIRCLVHDTASARSMEHHLTTDRGLESVYYVDYANPDTRHLQAALSGVKSVYVNTPPSANVLAMRENIARALSHNARTVQHVVLLSEPIEMTFYGFSDYWDHHKAGVDALERTGLPLTTLHPSWFMDSFPAIVGNDLFQRVGNNPASYSAVDDVAAVAARILVEGPGQHAWKRYTLINEVLTGAEIAAVMSEATGRSIQYEPITIEEFWRGMISHDTIHEKEAEGYARAMKLNNDGHHHDGDLGQLRLLLRREPRTALEVFRGLLPYFNSHDGIQGNEPTVPYGNAPNASMMRREEAEEGDDRLAMPNSDGKVVGGRRSEI